MAESKVYIIDNTDGTIRITVQPKTYDGVDGIKSTTDLTYFGNSTLDWGERVNENFLRLLENFATEEGDPETPKTSEQIGRDYYGVNKPIIGQLWYNKTKESLYTYNGTSEGWVRATFPQTYLDNRYFRRDGGEVYTRTESEARYVNITGDAMTGFLTLHAKPTQDLHAATKEYVDDEIEAAITGGASGLFVNVSGDTMTGFLTLHANPTNNLHAVTKQYVDGNFLSLTGGTMTGAITMTAAITAAGHLATKQYVDDRTNFNIGDYYTRGEAEARYVNISGDTMTGFLTLHANPTNNLHAATKQYVDSKTDLTNYYTKNQADARYLLKTSHWVSYNAPTNAQGVDGDVWFQLG